MNSRGNPRAKPQADAFAQAVWRDHVRSLYADGMTHQGIADELNRREVPTAKEKTWYKQTVTRLIRRISPGKPISGGGQDRRPVSSATVDTTVTSLAPPNSRHAQDLLSAALAGDVEARVALLELLGGKPIEPDWESEIRPALYAATRACDARLPWDRESLWWQSQYWGVCAQVQVLGLIAQEQRMSGDRSASKSTLVEAWELAGDCQQCHADLFKRTAILNASKNQYELSFENADSAVQLYVTIGHNGHDLYGAGLQLASYVRGQARWFLGHYLDAAHEFEECLKMLVPDDHEDLYCYVTTGLAIALKDCGSEGQKEAAEILRGIRKSNFMKRERRDSVHLARLNWLEGSLKYNCRIGPPCRSRQMVQEGLEIFIARQMPDEAIAILSDLAKMARPRWDAVPSRTLIENLLARHEPSLGALKISDAARSALSRLKKACADWGWDHHKTLYSAIHQLRETGDTSGVLPCLI